MECKNSISKYFLDGLVHIYYVYKIYPEILLFKEIIFSSRLRVGLQKSSLCDVIKQAQHANYLREMWYFGTF